MAASGQMQPFLDHPLLRRAGVEARFLARTRAEPVPPPGDEQAMVLWQAVQGLPSRQRAALVLRAVGQQPQHRRLRAAVGDIGRQLGGEARPGGGGDAGPWSRSPRPRFPAPAAPATRTAASSAAVPPARRRRWRPSPDGQGTAAAGEQALDRPWAGPERAGDLLDGQVDQADTIIHIHAALGCAVAVTRPVDR
jgi:hypothetical protein